MVEENDYWAFEWYLKAAEKGHVKAQCKIADMCKWGMGVEESSDAAEKWYQVIEMQAEQGDAEAQYFLGKLYGDYSGRYGWGADKRLATKWYRKAAEQGHEEALRALEKRR